MENMCGRVMTKVKYVSSEYHEGWQDAMAEDVQDIKRLILTIVEPTEKKDMN